MIVIVSADGVFSEMLQYELEARLLREVRVISPEKSVENDVLYRAALVVADIDLPEITQREILQIADENQIKIIGFGYTTPEELPSSLRRQYEAQNGFSFFHRPFSMRTFLTKAAVGLSKEQKSRAPEAPVDIIAELKLNRAKRCVHFRGVSISLSGREFDVFSLLMQKRGKTISRAELHETIWGKPLEPNDNIVDVNIKNLRKKTEAVLKTKIIYSVRGVGYTIPDGTQGGILSC